VNTVRGECFKLLALANWGVSHGHCQPVEFAPPAPVIESPIAFTESELRRMMIAATLYRGTINGTPGSVFLLAPDRRDLGHRGAHRSRASLAVGRP
jgi:hypothetical protein